MKTALDWFDSEPTTSELAAIEAEWPVIAAELSLLDRLVAFDDLDAFFADSSLYEAVAA